MPYPAVRVTVTGFIAVSDLQEFLPKIEGLFEKQNSVFQQLMTKCIFPQYELPSGMHKILNQLGLLKKNGSVKNAVTAIVTHYVESQPKDEIEFYRKTASLLRIGVLEKKVSEEVVLKELEEYAKEVFRKKVDRAEFNRGKLPSIDGKLDLKRCPDIIKNDPYACTVGVGIEQVKEKISETLLTTDKVVSPRTGVAHRLSGVCKDPLPSEVDVIKEAKAPLPNEVDVIREAKAPIDPTFTAKALNFLFNHKYELLLTATLMSYVIYDHYHENHVGKMTVAYKNSWLSLWKEKTETSKEIEKENKKETVLNFPAPGSSPGY